MIAQVSLTSRSLISLKAAASGAPTGDTVDVGTPFYQDGQLQVHVYWQKTLGMLGVISVTSNLCLKEI